ncbi:DAN domain family member 5 [Echeneis naucrates]|nr:DAN domain family member 5-like [Echeneis naucrates]
MAFFISLIFLSGWTASAFTIPHNTFVNTVEGSMAEAESSGSGPDEPLRGTVKVVQLNPPALTQSSFFRRGFTQRGAPSLRPKLPFPAFLSQGRPGVALVSKAPVNPLRRLHPKTSTEIELKKRQSLQMWQRAVDKGTKTVPLPVSLKDTKQTCTAVPFTQRVTKDGCETVSVHNKLCFGQCSSLFVPSEGEFAGLAPGTGAFHHRAPCSRCAPSKAHTVTVHLRCGTEVQERRVMMVEECKCETGGEERAAESAASIQL